jgi:hypothetical protein
MQSKLKQKTQKKKILNENTQVSNDHTNMLKTITEEPVLKEGKCEPREARGPKPLMIKKQQSIESGDEESMVQTNRTAQAASEEEHALT